MVAMGEPLRSYESPVMENQSQFSASLSGMILHLNAQDQETNSRLRQLEDSVKELLEASLKRSEPSPEEMQRLNDANQRQDSAAQKAGEAVESCRAAASRRPTKEYLPSSLWHAYANIAIAQATHSPVRTVVDEASLVRAASAGQATTPGARPTQRL